MKDMALDANYLKTETFTLGSTNIIKNMVKDHSIGSIFANLLASKQVNLKSHNIMAFGGEVYLMDKVNIKNLMVKIIFYSGDIYVG